MTLEEQVGRHSEEMQQKDNEVCMGLSSVWDHSAGQ